VSDNSDNPLSSIALRSIIPLEVKAKDKDKDKDKTEGPTVKSITSLSHDSVKRHFPHLVVKLSPRREGMSLGNALDIAAGRAPRNPKSDT
jgi:hypothetical protein